MIDVDAPDGMLLQRLMRELHERRTGYRGGRRWNRQTVSPSRARPPLQLLDDYRRGDPPLRSDIHSGWKPHIRQFVRMGRLNMADLVVSSTSNRLRLRDFRTSAADDELGDREARRIMAANDLSVVSRDLQETVLTLGDGYVILTPPGASENFARITDEDPRQTIAAVDPVTRRELCGLKLFRDDWDSEDLAFLFLPGLVKVARRKGRTSIVDSGGFRFDAKSWDWDDSMAQAVPGNVVPIVAFKNRDGIGEFERHLDTLDRINDKIFDEWWIAKIQAFRQRAVKNLPDTKLVEDGSGGVREEPVADDEYDGMFVASPDEMWQVPGDVEFWESAPVDLTPITNAIEKDRARLASSTQSLLHTITPDAAQGSAEGASLLREEFTFKCEDRRDRLSGRWARVMSMAFLFQGDTARADVTQIEAMWAPVVRHSLSEMGSAAAQAVGSLPIDIIRRDIWQYSPAEVQEMANLDGRDLLRRVQGNAGQSTA